MTLSTRDEQNYCVETIIESLSMQPHPEGGWYTETFRDTNEVAQSVHSTAIYFLLAEGQRSHWHRLTNATEVWHFYMGSPLELSLWQEGGAVSRVILGPDLESLQRPQVIIPRGMWQSAAPLGEFTLAGCTVAPGFSFSDFELAPPGWHPGQAS
ncbi:cupin domain-containing protein [Phyllobacterium ifriqiyense]|uniref:cupin domain-containing protein n=1 Tax=Phyllobacterium ifriqiyense TaxID=314238 RepID=UPI00339131AF